MKRLLVLSGKGGTGKTTVSAALIRFSGAKAIADCDVDAPNLHIVTKTATKPEVTPFYGGKKAVLHHEKCIGCGVCEEHCRFHAITLKEGIPNISEFFCEGCGVCQYVCPQDAITLTDDIAGEQKLYIGDQVFSTATLKMGRGNSGKLVMSVKKSMLKAASAAELAIVDGSPGIGCPVMASVSGMDLVLIVAEPSLSGLSDLQRLYKTITNFQAKAVVCVNKWDISPQNTAAIEAFCAEQNISFVGKIPYDKKASAAINAGMSLADIDCDARDALQEVYHRIMKQLGL